MSCCESCTWDAADGCCIRSALSEGLPPCLPRGAVVEGYYRIEDMISRDTKRISYVAWDRLTMAEVELREHFPCQVAKRSTDGSVRATSDWKRWEEHFIAEAAMLEQLADVPGLQKFQRCFTGNGTSYMVLERPAGMSLEERVAREGPLTAEETFQILRPVMETLSKLHARGYLHCRIAPWSIWLTESGEVQLRGLTQPFPVSGDFPEDPVSGMAPMERSFSPIELHLARPGCGRFTDVYLVCATARYCLTGKAPEEAVSRLEHGRELTWPPEGVLPEHQRKALDKGLSLRKKERQQDIDSLLRDLFPEPEPPTERVIFRGVMADGTHEIHYIDENGEEWHIYGRPVFPRRPWWKRRKE